MWCTVSPALAKVQVNALFGDGMVVQRDKPIAVYGTADPGETVLVGLCDKQVVATADSKGDWRAMLPALPAGGPFNLGIRGDKNKIVVRDVLIGEVWICSGQSNMCVPVSYANHTQEDITNSNNPRYRIFTMKENFATDPCKTVTGEWKHVTPDVVKDFPAVPYYFGKDLGSDLKVPVGIIVCAYPGTPINTWMSIDALDKVHESATVNLPENFKDLKHIFDQKLLDYTVKLMEARKNGLPEPVKPLVPDSFFVPTSGFCGMLCPLIPYSIRGFYWYQGESDTNFPARWHRCFAAFVDDLRHRWNDEKLPFLYVQIAGFDKRQDLSKPTDSMWAELREGQTLARRIPYAYMVSAIDLTEEEFCDGHPKEKKILSHRAAEMALALVYHEPRAYSGPIYDSVALEGNKIRVVFRFAHKGLVVKGDKLKGFEVAGIDKHFYPAQATVEGSTVVAWSDKVTAPVAVRYGWAANPIVNLYNRDDFPCLPFRSDKWINLSKKKSI